ncbi:hypothetical protein BU15DRAFT_81691 [Melanogaster broomeanus]|nr:hypothetical protein BU15DRAFT_81691 [Melanogaster broomeanus]
MRRVFLKETLKLVGALENSAPAPIHSITPGVFTARLLDPSKYGLVVGCADAVLDNVFNAFKKDHRQLIWTASISPPTAPFPSSVHHTAGEEMIARSWHFERAEGSFTRPGHSLFWYGISDMSEVEKIVIEESSRVERTYLPFGLAKAQLGGARSTAGVGLGGTTGFAHWRAGLGCRVGLRGIRDSRARLQPYSFRPAEACSSYRSPWITSQALTSLLTHIPPSHASPLASTKNVSCGIDGNQFPAVARSRFSRYQHPIPLKLNPPTDRAYQPTITPNLVQNSTAAPTYVPPHGYPAQAVTPPEPPLLNSSLLICSPTSVPRPGPPDAAQGEAAWHLSRLFPMPTSTSSGHVSTSKVQLTFIPTISPFFSSILSTLSFLLCTSKLGAADIVSLYASYYAGERLVQVQKSVPTLANVHGKRVGW